MLLGPAPKPLQRCWFIGDAVGKKFESDKPGQTGIFGLVDDAHASAADFFEHPIMGNSRTDHDCGESNRTK